MKTYLLNVMVGADNFVSALTGGDPDEAISSRLGKAQRGDFGTAWRCALLPLIFVVNCIFLLFERQWGHCLRNIEGDEGEREVLLKATK